MNGNCHLIFGAAVGTTVALNLPLISNYLPNITDTSATATLFILGGLMGGVFPDVDNPNSYIGKLTVPVSSVIEMISGLFGKTGKNHRGIFHDPICYVALLVASYFYIPSICGFFVGCLSHLILDAFTPAGIPILGIKQLHLGKINSGSKAAIVFTWVSTILVLIFGIGIRFSLI